MGAALPKYEYCEPVVALKEMMPDIGQMSSETGVSVSHLLAMLKGGEFCALIKAAVALECAAPNGKPGKDFNDSLARLSQVLDRILDPAHAVQSGVR